jgi:hypothetical protein
VTGEIFKSIASAKAIAFILVAWGVPVAIGMAAWWLVALPAWQDHLLPVALLDRLRDTDLSGRWAFLLAWFLLTMLLGLNATFFFRLYEGYYLWRSVAERKTETHRLHRENLFIAERLQVLEEQEDEAGTSDPERTAELAEYRGKAAEAHLAARRRVFPVRRWFTDQPLSGLRDWRDYPEEDLLPTALGNRIRAFERYGNSRFGLDILILWYEFVGVASDQVRDHIDGARQEVEVFLAGSVVFALFSIATLIPLADPATWSGSGWVLLIAGLIGAVVSMLSYRRAISQAEDWGAAVTGLVNTHRTEVAKAFGFELPDSLEAERRMWECVNGFVATGGEYWELYYDDLPRRRPVPARPALSASAVPTAPVPPAVGRRGIVRSVRALLASMRKATHS